MEKLDQIDRAMLRELARDGRLPVTDLAQRVGLSKTPCQKRFKRLLEKGFIQGFRAVLDPVKLDRQHVAFTEVKLSQTTEKALSEFNRAVLGVPEIESCHMIAGAFDYLLKVRSRDVSDYRRVLGEVISALPFVDSTSTHVSMQSVKDSVL